MVEMLTLRLISSNRRCIIRRSNATAAFAKMTELHRVPQNDTVFVYGNYGEAALWAVIAVVIAVRSRRADAVVRRIGVVAAVAFCAFGVSDVVEASTGAWWRPWSLLVWKAVCVVVFVGLFAGYVRHTRREARKIPPRRQ